MSYDIIVLSRNGQVDQNDLQDHLLTHPYATQYQNTIDYENPKSGVHFQWIIGADDAYNPDDMPGGQLATLVLNFNRPTPFAQEAAHVLIALSKRLAVMFYDMQSDLLIDRYSDPAELVQPYVSHAQVAISALRSQDADLVASLRMPTIALQAIWRWNFDRDAFTDGLGEDLFVPRVQLMMLDNRLQTFAIWGGDAVPMLCPQVDILLISRTNTAPKSGFLKRRQQYYDLVPFDHFCDHFSGHFKPDTRVPRAVACKPGDQPALTKHLMGMPMVRPVRADAVFEEKPFEIIPFHTVLDDELFHHMDPQGMQVIESQLEER
ncbi:hypothetical protein [Parasulfitobacter algicola]|uniref:Uncharacterized protein n=1 Tax=Parasulfitobacter algicola TaxID=2614809 RepID=A0ABX2ITQ4_9RHOB|nr:hypothetical protein [Sulfitobacter algicola]NSX56294.1 hypothetical protein [Sulfitobacter algicola]